LFSNQRIRVGEELISYLDGCIKHPGQVDVHFTDWRYVVLDWGRRTGKTICAAAEIVGEVGLPDRRVWIVAPNYELTDRVFEYVYKWIVLDQCFGPGSVVKASKSQTNRYIELAWGSFVKGKSAEAPDSLVGDQLDLVVIDEAARIPEMIWLENLEPTTIDRKGRAMFISTPRGKNWFYEYYLRGEEPETRKKGWISSRVKTADNPFTDKDYLESKRAQTPELVWRREYEASFEDWGGLVFPEFKATTDGHLYDPKIKNPDHGTVYRGIDIGFRLPTACVWGKVDRHNNLWVFREYEEANLNHDDHVENINAQSPEPVYQTYISPDAARKFGTNAASDRNSPMAVYRAGGIYARPADDQINPGLSVVSRYLRATLEKNPDHPKLFISVACPKLIKTLETYQFAEVNNRTELDQPDKPRKKDDHLPDALRYMLTARPRYLNQNSHLGFVDQSIIEHYGDEGAAYTRRAPVMNEKASGMPKIHGWD